MPRLINPMSLSTIVPWKRAVPYVMMLSGNAQGASEKLDILVPKVRYFSTWRFSTGACSCIWWKRSANVLELY
jgi:hypothetical protein